MPSTLPPYVIDQVSFYESVEFATILQTTTSASLYIMDQSTNNNTTEEVLVLYGSQTGNSEGAAQEICSLIPTKLSSTTSRVMHLDDFLEVEKAKWTKLVVIVCSSYGVGQAPIGGKLALVLFRFGHFICELSLHICYILLLQTICSNKRCYLSSSS